MSFPKAASETLRDSQLRRNLAKATGTIRAKRAGAVGELPDWSELRSAGRAIPTMSHAPWCSWRANTTDSSLAPRSTSTAACLRADAFSKSVAAIYDRRTRPNITSRSSAVIDRRYRKGR